MKKEDYVKRFKELAGIKETKKKVYLIKITFIDIVAESLNEHQVYKNFKNSTNRYTYHHGSTNPPVKSHYQVYPNNGKTELYAVRVEDGKAHHKKNKGYLIPQKEADELRSLGVKLPSNNIIETITSSDHLILNENLTENIPIYLIFE